ncbi:PDZ domain-containing protein [Streptomyces sp. NPDC020298]|uniref:PDZ domain-containing protein n=1 Tax=unclassified Streptomyces TaxID=2593676 RepID=UPI0033C0B93D
MEQTALRPKPIPGQNWGQEPGQERRDGGPSEPTRRPHATRRRGRPPRTVLLGLFTGAVLVLSGVGLGTAGTTAIGMGRLAEPRRQAPPPGHPAPAASSAAQGPARAVPAATLGLEVMDAGKAGALVVGVHVPGPGYAAGLVRGDVLLQVGKTRVGTAADLVRAVAVMRPGARVTLTVRHRGGGSQQLTAVPGVVT